MATAAIGAVSPVGAARVAGVCVCDRRTRSAEQKNCGHHADTCGEARVHPGTIPFSAKTTDVAC